MHCETFQPTAIWDARIESIDYGRVTFTRRNPAERPFKLEV